MSQAVGPIRSDTAATRLRILRAAEALYAEKGVDGVSMQEIGREAGQRNRSAISYHFGDKAALLAAVLERHAEPVADERSRLLDEIESAGRSRELSALAEAYVLPVAARAEDADGGMAFVRVSAGLVGHPRYSRLYFGRRDDSVASRRLVKLVAEAGPELPQDFRLPRTIATTALLLHGIADWSTASEGRSQTTLAREWAALKTCLVESVAALWSLPFGA